MKRRCVLHCRLHGTRKCEECTLADETGAVHCPGCGGDLTWIGVVDGQAKLACDGRTGCGRTVSVPVGDVDEMAIGTADKRERKRQRDAERVRRYRERQRTAATIGV